MLKFLLGILVTLTAIGAIGGAYFLGLKQTGKTITPVPNPTTVVQTTVSTAPANTTISPTQKAEFVNPSVTIANIEDAVKSKNYAALGGYMVPSVYVGIESSGCCGMLTSADATAKLSYLDKATAPWDFSDTNPIAKQLAEKNPDHYKGYYIGTSANRMVAAFHLNDKYLIDKIFMSVDYKLTLP